MADSTLQILLDKGLNTVTPALLSEPGTLIDCLNYEMDADVGYRRIDGYEPYDGWVGGEIQEYYRVNVSITDATVVASLVLGAVVANTDTNKIAAIVLDYTGNTVSGVLTYAATNPEAPILVSGSNFGTSATGAARFAATSTAVKGSVDDTGTAFLTNLRTYSAALRDEILPTINNVAGLHWFRDNLIVAADSWVFTMTGSNSGLKHGAIVGWEGDAYRILEVKTFTGPTRTTLYAERIRANSVSPDVSTLTIVGESVLGSNPTISTPGGISSVALSSTSPSRQASLWALYTPESSEARGSTLLGRTVFIQFANATAAAEADWVPVRYPGYGDLPFGNTGNVLFGPNDTNVMGGPIKNVWVTSGEFADGDAAGWLEVYMPSDGGAESGSVGVITTAWDIYGGVINPYTKRADLTDFFWSTIPGTLALREAETRYVADNYNFFGQQHTLEAYGATGASRAFWARAWRPSLVRQTKEGQVLLADDWRYTWGNIFTDEDVTVDKPKYCAYHAGRLALGHGGGSVVLSVVGEPGIFDGFLGATEIATGDFITGLVEAQGDSLIVFGNKSIRRITGTVDADMQLTTVSSNSGAYDYTCVSVGSTPVFTGPNGISTIEQAQQYGDFKGSRVSDAVSNSLVSKLVTDWSDTTAGGVAMALPVRSKNQYRLWLTTGEVYTVTFTTKGPRVMKSNYGTFVLDSEDTLNVPFAWSSGVSDHLKEHIHVAWDADLATQNINVTGVVASAPSQITIYELDRGWGFDGYTFDSYIELGHVFPATGTNFATIEKVRLYGMSHGLANLRVQTSGIEDDFEQEYPEGIRDISLPPRTGSFFFNMRPVTAIIDQANWGLGIKLKIVTGNSKGLPETEPPHICQILSMYVKSKGALDG